MMKSNSKHRKRVVFINQTRWKCQLGKKLENFKKKFGGLKNSCIFAALFAQTKNEQRKKEVHTGDERQRESKKPVRFWK